MADWFAIEETNRESGSKRLVTLPCNHSGSHRHYTWLFDDSYLIEMQIRLLDKATGSWRNYRAVPHPAPDTDHSEDAISRAVTSAQTQRMREMHENSQRTFDV